ncbi:hypothetical protein Q7C_705 [Methylophaga frappieri]|uniref:Uncharacterized protein n=1 Tax=Methylophaga frappieri (strain ATCC BAA-2434 / DSM 25690 / JAM7) TaxID=754477 RepID=I1YG33_METFJ|nr:hypothetical protein Q7C_705 [Methylophaga frappieri]
MLCAIVEIKRDGLYSKAKNCETHHNFLTEKKFLDADG